MYMVSWTKTLKESFKEVARRVNLNGFNFVDLGAGKGKVVLLARELKILGSKNERYAGIDFESTLIEVAKSNSFKLFGDEGFFLNVDVYDIEWEEFSQKLLVYLYNPFDNLVLTKVLERIKDKQVVVIYVNPVHSQTFQAKGYYLLYEKIEWHANLNFSILTNSPKLLERS